MNINLHPYSAAVVGRGKQNTKSGHPVYKVVLTGGPCGGKSSSLASLVDRLSGLGFYTYASPEVATILIGAGARPTFPGWNEVRAAVQALSTPA